MNIHKRSNVTTMKSILDKKKEDDADIRRNTKKDTKLKKDVFPWKKEKSKNYKRKKRRKSSTKRWRIKYEDIKFK